MVTPELADSDKRKHRVVTARHPVLGRVMKRIIPVSAEEKAQMTAVQAALTEAEVAATRLTRQFEINLELLRDARLEITTAREILAASNEAARIRDEASK